VTRDEIVAAGALHEIPAYPRWDLCIERGEGTRVFDADGTAYLDLYGGHAVAILGHAPPRVAEAVARQARRLLFYSNTVHLEVRALAAERICRLAPWPGARVFFVNSGTEANETALKIARAATGRTGIAAFRGGFHGRTLGALAACGMESYRKPHAKLLDAMGGVTLADFNDASGLERAIGPDCAAAIVEPIQSMGGVRTMTPEFARALRLRCDRTGALLVFDEIQTAPGRTGHWFAGERWGVAPDLITLAKGIGGGFPCAALLARPEIAATVRPGDQGTTFGGGPLACAAIDATLAALEEIDAPAAARGLEERFRAGLAGCAGLEEIRGLGGLLGLRVRGDAAAAQKSLFEREKVLVGGCPGDRQVLRIFPPLTISPEEEREAIRALRSVLG
jgi:acetylornithine aminotransferase/acetylornithine/N-succinyldiaminopimelate aminotransferase